MNLRISNSAASLLMGLLRDKAAVRRAMASRDDNDSLASEENLQHLLDAVQDDDGSSSELPLNEGEEPYVATGAEMKAGEAARAQDEKAQTYARQYSRGGVVPNHDTGIGWLGEVGEHEARVATQIAGKRGISWNNTMRALRGRHG